MTALIARYGVTSIPLAFAITASAEAILLTAILLLKLQRRIATSPRLGDDHVNF